MPAHSVIAIPWSHRAHNSTIVEADVMIPDDIRLTDTRWGPEEELRVFTARNPVGKFNGYVCIPPEHPWYGCDYSECTLMPQCEESWCEHTPEANLRVHGGITYASAQDDWWCFGWDTAHYHSGDWSEAAVLMETYLLAAQLLAVWKGARDADT